MVQMRSSRETENARFGACESLFQGEGLKPCGAPREEKSQSLGQIASKGIIDPICYQEGFGKLTGLIHHGQA